MQDVTPNTARLAVAHTLEPIDSVPARSHPVITTRYGWVQGLFPGKTRTRRKREHSGTYATPDYERWKD
ncbi:hypothetical protein D9611_013163 [Ephemerocybe angulata]|uniref:Uncharacterized protein n=1 Tax=Ephemerocybe angulata TaxID=980116 RepID=A0A8H5BTT4_9AGAR|nr:hypothetical protein D9611_013163 [Tulosesus angulatus]